MRFLHLAAFFSMILAATPGIACTPVAGYRIPTNVELVQRADLIVLARVVAGPPASAPIGVPWSDPPKVILDPVEVLKGELPKEIPRLFGVTFARNGPIRATVTPLTNAHPSAYAGGCVRNEYAVGTLVVAMFKRTPDGLKQLDFPFARQAEDVAAPSDTWVRAVRFYVNASRGAAGEQRQRFQLLKDSLARDGDGKDREISKDIGRYLATDPQNAGRSAEMW
ncbi:hypothetical protein [Phenylobacterium sp.]|uniref:hypothetical protein n=1 Tax=Phenylobacterium sp. TaxID=1871053 RepID=UPI003BAA859E